MDTWIITSNWPIQLWGLSKNWNSQNNQAERLTSRLKPYEQVLILLPTNCPFLFLMEGLCPILQDKKKPD